MTVAKGLFRIEAVVRHDKKKNVDILVRMLQGWKQFEHRADTFMIRGLHPEKSIEPGWCFKGQVTADNAKDQDFVLLIYPV